jgi:hypothetical protein
MNFNGTISGHTLSMLNGEAFPVYIERTELKPQEADVFVKTADEWSKNPTAGGGEQEDINVVLTSILRKRDPNILYLSDGFLITKKPGKVFVYEDNVTGIPYGFPATMLKIDLRKPREIRNDRIENIEKMVRRILADCDKGAIKKTLTGLKLHSLSNAELVQKENELIKTEKSLNEDRKLRFVKL